MPGILSPSAAISQNPRLSFCSSISSHDFLICNILSHGGDSRLHVGLSSRRKLSLQCRHSDYRQRFGASDKTSYPGNSSFTPDVAVAVEPLPPRVFVGYSIYKGKAALTVEPKTPEFTLLESGAYKLSREGSVTLQFAPAAAVREYDWGRKQVFSLSVVEIATLIGLGAGDTCEFFHDPFKGRSDEGKVRKVLKVEPLKDGSGHFFYISVQNKMTNADENIYIPVTKAEFTVLKSAFNFILPYLVGWHAYADTIRPEISQRTNNGYSGSGGDF
ncbi:hypothetical protein SAY86_017085 [Trapa natans]|uniref:Uncharacterized protein n=1 Tax=Trapa natans TaxID=22666 RepID=A0AAN7R727_TRANT|nr:hypothetical protein SAY86_017085 [Trapa natans]